VKNVLNALMIATSHVFLFIINVISLSSIKFCLSIYGVFFYFGGVFEFIYFKKYHIFFVNYFYVN